MNNMTIVSARKTSQLQQLDRTYLDNFHQLSFLQGVIEGFIDGILILTEQGELIHANECAKQICHQLAQRVSKNNAVVPEEIWRICKFLINNCNLFADGAIILHDEIIVESTAFRVRVQWLNLVQFERPCLLVTMENQCQAIQASAIAEAQKHALTPGETKVWLLYRSNYTYKQIAAELYISLNTVKKHMKNIHAKRKVVLGYPDD